MSLWLIEDRQELIPFSQKTEIHNLKMVEIREEDPNSGPPHPLLSKPIVGEVL